MPKKSSQWEVIWESDPDIDAEERLLRALELLLPPLNAKALDESVASSDKQEAF